MSGSILGDLGISNLGFSTVPTGPSLGLSGFTPQNLSPSDALNLMNNPVYSPFSGPGGLPSILGSGIDQNNNTQGAQSQTLSSQLSQTLTNIQNFFSGMATAPPNWLAILIGILLIFFIVRNLEGGSLVHSS